MPLMTNSTKARRSKPRGFAAILLKNPELVSRISSMGGKTVARRRGWMAKIGRLGGKASGESKREARQERRLNRIERLALSHA